MPAEGAGAVSYVEWTVARPDGIGSVGGWIEYSHEGAHLMSTEKIRLWSAASMKIA